MYKTLKLRDLPSGQALRNYRRRLAGFSRSKGKESTLTSKFKLELPVGCSFADDFKEFHRLYNVIEGCGKGSLAYFLFSVILSGFRIFSSASEAILFATNKAYDEDAFSEALTAAAGAPLPDFTVVNLLKRLKTGVRSTNGKNNRFTSEVIVSEYRKTLCRKTPKQADETVVQGIFEAVALSLSGRFDSWTALQKDPIGACDAVDDALKRFGQFPKLGEMVRASQCSLPKKSTIVFDPAAWSLKLADDSAAYVPYAVVSTILSYPERADDDDKAVFVSLHLTTTSANGLSWLFNSGLKLFKEKSVPELRLLYGVSEDQAWRIRQIREAALAIPPQTFFFKARSEIGYHDFRSSFAGRITSWTSNYIKRLEELTELLQLIGDTLAVPSLTLNGKDFLETTDCKRDEITTLCEAYARQQPLARRALANLLGKGLSSTESDVNAVVEFSELVNRLFAVRAQIENALEQAESDKDSEWKGLSEAAAKDLSSWKRLVRLPKLNQMTGGVPDVKGEVDKSLQRFHEARNGLLSHFSDVKKWVANSGFTVDVLGSVAQTEKLRADKKFPGQYNAGELALRNVLQRIARTVRDRDDPCAKDLKQWFLDQAVFAERKDFNLFFFNRKGSIYVSPYSTRRHQGYELGDDWLNNRKDLWHEITTFLHEHRDVYPNFSDAAETFLRLETLIMGLYAGALPEAAPSFVSRPRLNRTTTDEIVPEALKLQLQRESVEPSVLAKVFNLYLSLISGSMFLLKREKFFLRTKFNWCQNTNLAYIPKNKFWKIPLERYINSPVWKEILKSDVIVWSKDHREVNVAETFKRAVAMWSPEKDFLRELFHQLPHDWNYELPLDRSGKANPVAGMSVDKNGTPKTILESRTFEANALARLVGPSSFKERLNELLLNPNVTVGDMTLMADLDVEQKLSAELVDFSPKEIVVSLAVPRKEPPFAEKALARAEKGTAFRSEPDAALPFKRIIGIDQGEAGLAYAVFNLSDAGKVDAIPIAAGTIRVPSIRRLIKKVNTYRKHGQSAQKFNQRFDSTLFVMRENVVGDVCGAIAGLMQRYHAVPVLEREVGNLESGGNQLKLVYKSVNTRFVADMIQAHQQERTSWWYGASSWVLPGFWEEVSAQYAKAQKGKKEIRKLGDKFFRPLQVAPGSTVNEKWTSRICSRCGNNLFELIDRAKAEKIKTIELDGNGEASLFGKTVKLYGQPSADASKKARRRNERASLVMPKADVKLDLAAFSKLAKSNLRRHPKSLQSKDTSQSRYFCVFKDCAWHNKEQHADINAAVNIGRRFLTRLIKEDKE